MTVRRRVTVSGKVQGVFFRDSCREEAEREGLAGWVTNISGGGVEAWFEGDESAVERLVEWCRSGPGAADVESVEVEDERPRGETGFSVR
ncbi:acylphosphatase [soil metagenome]